MPNVEAIFLVALVLFICVPFTRRQSSAQVFRFAARSRRHYIFLSDPQTCPLDHTIRSDSENSPGGGGVFFIDRCIM